MNIVAKFQERLDIGRGEAIARVIVFIFLSICFVATAVAPFLIFPYKTNIKEKNSNVARKSHPSFVFGCP